MTRLTKILLATVALAATTAGCHRQYYRKQADCEVNSLIAEKASHVARPPNVPYDVNVDRRSRMFNPFDLDFQPMPLDDPASQRYMQCVDGRRGYPMWEAAGLTNTAESPDWWQFLPLDEDGVLVLNSENAVRIALLHSPAYQRQVESLYLSALTVSSERFQFDTNFFGGLGASGIGANGNGPSYTFGSSDLSFRRNLAWGGSLVAGVANSIVWNLSDANNQPNFRTSTTLLDFTLIQPLLRNAGRDVVLEDLTQAERNLLAEVRSFERYRRGFFLQITTTGRPVQIDSSGIVTISAGVSGNAGGFLGLLQSQLNIRNQEENVSRQTENLLLIEDNLIELLTKIPDDPGEIITQRIQVAQQRQSLLNSQSSLINQQANYQRDVDIFMRDLGLPPYICARIADPILDQFNLIDRTLLKRREELTAVRSNVGAINIDILGLGETVIDPVTNLPNTQLRWTPELQDLLRQLRNELTPMAEFNRQLVEADLALIAKDIEDLEAAVPRRQSQNEDLLQLYQKEQSSICALVGVNNIDESLFDLDAVIGLSGELRNEYAALEENLRGYDERIATLSETMRKLTEEGPDDTDPGVLAVTLRDEVILYSQQLLADIGDDVLAIQLIQARARTESVLLPEVDMDPPVAFEIARRNRRDWANVRAALVDSWRQIEVLADDLESVLDLEVNGAVSSSNRSPGQGPYNSTLTMGLRWDAPLTRLLERNAYRSTLIRYEQDRRLYYGYEDSIWQLLRNEIRQLQVNRFNFEIGRQAVRSAAAQIDLNTDRRKLDEVRGRASGPTAARDAIQALNDLLTAQNGLLGTFVTYEVLRRSLDFDLGTMELTPEGLWIDPGVISPEALVGLPGTMVDGMIECGCNDCGIRYNPLPPEPVFSDALMGIGEDDSARGEIPSLPGQMEGQYDSDPGAFGELPAPVHTPQDTAPMPLPAPVAEPNSPADFELPAPVPADFNPPGATEL